MEIVVAVAIAILGTIFLGALVALIVVCTKHYCKKKADDLISRQTRDMRSDSNLVENMEGDQEPTPDLEMDDVKFSTNLEKLLKDNAWVNDATGLAPHCLAILKTCHTLTEKLVGMTMGSANSYDLRNPELLTDVVSVAKKISPRVDEVVHAMYPPLDPRLLEARCSALVLSVSHLVLITKNACRLSGVLDWIDQSLAEVDDHLKVLKEASACYESHMQSPPANNTQNSTAESSLQQPQPSTQVHAPGGPDTSVFSSPAQLNVAEQNVSNAVQA